jgi:hypothetical protein
MPTFQPIRSTMSSRAASLDFPIFLGVTAFVGTDRRPLLQSRSGVLAEES